MTEDSTKQNQSAVDPNDPAATPDPKATKPDEEDKAVDPFMDDEVMGKAYDARLFKRVLKYVSPYKALLGVTLGMTVMVSIVEVIWPALLGSFLDGPFMELLRGTESGGLVGDDAVRVSNELTFFVGLFVGYVLLEMGFRWLHLYLTTKLGQHVIYDIRTQLFGHLQKLGLRYFERNPVGRLVTRVTSDVEALNELFTSGLVALLADLLKIVVIVVIMLVINTELALIVIAVTPLVVIATWVFRNRARHAFREMRKRIAAVNAFLQEAIGGIRIIQIFRQEAKMAARLDRRNRSHYDASLVTVFNFSMFMPMVSLFANIAVAALLFFGGMKLLEAAGASAGTAGVLTIGGFTQFYFWTRLLFEPIRELSEKYNVLQSAMASSERIFRIVDTEPEIRAPDSPASIPDSGIRGRIEFDHVWFAYNEPDWVLRDVSFTIEPGQHLAIVGATGGGKTTITNLVARFYDVQKGRVLVDGIDVRDYDPAELRRHVGLVLQDVFLFSGSIETNIKLGEDGITREKVEEVADLLQAAPFIEQLPHGYAQDVHERGLTLSTGQRQLIAFARALAFDPRILILDEATANIDTESERLIQDALQTLMRGRTAIIVAHRLSTIKQADQILVIHKGEIRERGKHDELLAINGIYARLYQLQYATQEAPTSAGATAS